MNKFLADNSLTAGVVTHADLVIHEGKDYGLRFIIEYNDSHFLVLKYHPDDDKRIKSAKYWTDMKISTYLKYNTKIPKVTKATQHLSFTDYINHLIEEKILFDENSNFLINSFEFMKEVETTYSDLQYDSYYETILNTPSDEMVYRLAFNTPSDCNVVVKVWWGDDNDEVKPMSIKFDKTSIEEMSKEWNMEEKELSDKARKYLGMLNHTANISGIPEIEEVEDITPNYSEEADIKRKDRIFNFRDIDLEYYIIDDRAVIVFQITSNDTYLYWEIKGGEAHRLTVSAKGPFDNTLMVKDDHPWVIYRYDQNIFLEKIGMTREEVVEEFSKHSLKWMINTNLVSILGGNK